MTFCESPPSAAYKACEHLADEEHKYGERKWMWKMFPFGNLHGGRRFENGMQWKLLKKA